MTEKEQKRAQIVAAVSGHLLREGFQNSGLRALARSAGVSDRMVMYYFATKDDLLAAALLNLAHGLADNLQQLLPARHATGAEIIAAVAAAANNPAVRSFLMLWFEIVGLAMRGNSVYRHTATLILDAWAAWISDKLGPRRAHQAPAVLAQLEGELMLSLLREPV